MSAVLKPQASTPPTVKLLINGKFVESKTKIWKDVVNPATQEVVARVPFATKEELDEAIMSAAEAFKTWKNSSIGVRARVMLKLQELIKRDMKKLAACLTAEQGKTLPDAEGDVFRGLEVVEHACGIGTLSLGEIAENVAGGIDTYFIRQPIGVCAGITPFNFPAMIPLWMFPMAIACGNTFVLKPSEQDPMTPMLLAELAIEAGVPPGVLNIVHGGKEAVDALCTHPEIKAVSFVGSCHVGEHVYKLSSDHGKRAQCMMGAKNHAIIMPDANKDQSLNALVGAKVSITSDKPQTTRRAIRGIATGSDWQLVLVDLPGVQRPRDQLTERMQHRVEQEVGEADASLDGLPLPLGGKCKAGLDVIGSQIGKVGQYLGETASRIGRQSDCRLS